MPRRILLAGIFHETHTFLDGHTALADFSVRRGDELFAARGDASPLAGLLEYADEAEWEVFPAIDMRTTPSAMVEDEVVALFWKELLVALEEAQRDGLDGVFLVLHGAMVSESYLDVEGEILSRLSTELAGTKIPVAGVFDLHANFTQAMADNCDVLVAYRHNPHTDAHESARRAAELLDRLLKDSQHRPQMVFSQPPVMWPPSGTGTGTDPMRTLEEMARQIEERYPEILVVNVCGGFAFADTPDTGVSFSAATLGDAGVAQREIDKLAEWTLAQREAGNVVPEDVETVMAKLAQHDRGPIVLIEPSDNIGGGGPGDGTGLLRALLEHQVQNAAICINDGAAVAAVSSLKPGERRTITLGGRGSSLDEGPVEIDLELVSTSDGIFELEDPHSHLASMWGRRIDMGPSAVTRHGGLTILLTTNKTPPFDLGQWRSQGIEPESLFAIGVKAAVAHRQAYDPIAVASYSIDTPGPCTGSLRRLPFRHIRRPIFPLDEL